jgi:hypothetical protein
VVGIGCVNLQRWKREEGREGKGWEEKGRGEEKKGKERK